MTIHFLPGDAYVATFKETGIEGEIAVCRECLIEGDKSGDPAGNFWDNRARFISSAHDVSREEYLTSSRPEFEKLLSAGPGDEIVLWFEYELFCQANLWFTLSFLRDSAARIVLVLPSVREEGEVWEGFGGLDVDGFRTCFEARRELTRAEIEMYTCLWEAFRNGHREELIRLADSGTAVPYLPEACLAAAEIDERPVEIVRQIRKEGITDFSELFKEYNRRAGVFRLGDTQVLRIFESLKSE